jgi:hypothetical protein
VVLASSDATDAVAGTLLVERWQGPNHRFDTLLVLSARHLRLSGAGVAVLWHTHRADADQRARHVRRGAPIEGTEAMAMTSMRLRRLQWIIGAAVIAVLLLPAAAVAESEPAPDEVGGWAVIDPVTGDVKNVIVCTESVCGATGEWGGVLPGDTSCAGCLLRKQTNGTSDGNVAGWRSSEGMAVTYDGDENGTFTIDSGGSIGSGDSVEQRMTLDPSRTATDPDGMDLHTGIIKRSTTGRFTEGGQTARATVDEQRPEGSALDSDRVVVEFDEWGQDFSYGSAPEAAASLEADVDAALGIEAEESDDVEGGSTTAAEGQPEDEPSGEAASSPSDNPVVRAIQTITQRIVTFLSSWFGG